MNKKALAFIIGSFGVGSAMAVPALPGLISVAQPDGTFIEAYIHGDEFAHFYTDAHGNYLQPDSKGFLRPSASKVDWVGINKRASERRAASSKYTSYPTTGQQKALVLLVEFDNNSFTYSEEAFSRMLNETGYSDYGASGSARDYFVENSAGHFLPDFDVYGPAKLAHPMSYYSADDDAKAYEMVVEACRQLDDAIDFSQYDRDGDGWVDNIYVFYAGYGQADGGGINTVWPHSSNVFRKGTTLLLDGVQIGQYACSNELIYGGRSMVGIGTFCHEFGHVLGLPDLYSTVDSSAITVGYWSLMDHGNYANNGRCPVALTGHERFFLGWCNPLILSDKAAVSLPPISSNFCCRINGSDAEEYFILEYRKKSGWDAYAPGEGLLVWHIDYDRDAWNSNTVNNYPSQLRVRIIPADGSTTLIGDAGDTYPGNKNITAVSDLKSWNGASSGVSVSGISSPDNYLDFSVNGGSDILETDSFNVSDVTDCEASISLSSDNSAPLHYFSVYYNENGRQRFVPGLSYLPISSISYDVEKLSPDTEYIFALASGSGSSVSKTVEKNVTTKEAGIRFFAPDNIAASEIGGTGFIISWSPMSGATDYYITVTHEEEGDASGDIVDFADRTNLPEGWSTSANNTMSVGGYYGEAAPSLRFSNNAENVESPVYSQAIQSLSFWMRGYQAQASSALNLFGLCDGEWVLLQSFKSIDNSAPTIVTLNAVQLQDVVAIRFVYESAGTGSICIDDIRVSIGNEIVTAIDFNKVSTTGEPSFIVDGLQSDTLYHVWIVASDGKHESLKSDVIEVRTLTSSSVDVVTENSPSLTIYDITGKIVYSGLPGKVPELPSGIYIIKSGSSVSKIFI